MNPYRVREEMNGIEDPEGKVWFWDLASSVIDADRCIQCGTCVAVCPSNSIGVRASNGLPELVKMCTGCSLCWDFCPRGGLRYEALSPAGTAPVGAGVAAVVTGPVGAVAGAPAGGEERSAADALGPVDVYAAVRASTRLGHVQDGGAVTAILCALLERDVIDGAVVTAASRDPLDPKKGVAKVATTREEILAAAGSFYNQTMALAALDLSSCKLPPQPRLAVVGTPCVVQGARAMQTRRWRTGAHRVDAVVLTIALMCSKNFEYEALMRRELRDRRGVDLERVQKVDVIRGRLIVEYTDGEVAVDESIKSFHDAALAGCDECADFSGQAADISVGSVGSIDGWTSILVRTARGRRAFDAARAALDVKDLDDVDALIRLSRADSRRAASAMQRPLDPTGALFISHADHVQHYSGTARQPVVLRR
ncbi:MAG: Coenzyme F420 hydrogenase/dehydrogenase, beta subunit C-terminal domain [Acidimicrobiales bacterium]